MNLEELIKKLDAGDNNIFVAQLRILKILSDEKGKNQNTINPLGLTLKKIVKEYLIRHEDTDDNKEREALIRRITESNDDNNKELKKEARMRKYTTWIKGLCDAELIIGEEYKSESCGQNPRVYHINNTFSNSVSTMLTNRNVSDEAKLSINLWMAFNKEISPLPIYEDINPFMNQIVDGFENLNGEDWIHANSFSRNIKASGESQKEAINIKDKIKSIYTCFHKRCSVSFTYLGMEIKNFIPCLLKEYKGTWHMIGFYINNENMSHYSLQKIQEIKQEKSLSSTEVKAQEKQKEKLRNIFKNSIGISAKWQNSDVKNSFDAPRESNSHSEPLKISFKLKDGYKFDNINYLKKNPIHHSQESINSIDSEGYETFNLKCFPDADLIREIRKFGKHNVKDISCNWIDPKKEALPELAKWVEDL